MASLNLSVAAVLVALTLLSYVAAKEDVVAVQRNVTMASSTERAATVSDGSTRTGRIMQIFKNDHRRLAGPARHVHTPPVMRARADRFPLNPQRLPIAHQRRPAAAMRPQILRRIQNNLPKGPPLRFQNQMPRYEVVKSSRYSPAKNGGSPNGITSGGAYRPQLQFGGGKTVAGGGGHQHPNALVSGSAYSSLQQNFKASPNFNGHVKIRPVMVAQQQKQQLQQKQPHQQQQALNQREQFATPNYQSQPHPYSSQQQQQQQPQQQQLQQQQHHFSFPQQLTSQQEPLPQLKSKVKPINFESPSAGDTSASLFNKATAPSGYAVYEDPEHQLQTAEDYNVRVTDQKSLREVQEYLKFMGSNVYFLPKRDPNYRDIDVERDHLQYHQQQPQPQQHYSEPMYDSAAAATAYQQFYQTPKVPSAPHNFFDEVPPSAASSATVVRSSYQAGQNEFVVSSDGKKGMKRIMPAPLTPSSTNAPAAYHAFQFSSARNRTPEPVRFEFTERDAISPTTYTHSPVTGQLRKSSSQEVRAVDRNYLASSSPRTPASGSATTRRTTSSPNYDAAIKQPVGENLDDPEDDDDMLDTDSDTYGRIPIYPSIAATSQEPPAEQKDTEDYCERICSNVQDDDEEIVCGSDGFMYTSEAQMECYASCLHIDVTIQSKGCNTR